MKRDGLAGSYCLLVHGGCFKTLEEKSTLLLGKIHEKCPGGHECNFLTSLPHLCAVLHILATCMICFPRLHRTGTPNDLMNEAVADQYLASIILGELKRCLVQFSLVMKASFPLNYWNEHWTCSKYASFVCLLIMLSLKYTVSHERCTMTKYAFWCYRSNIIPPSMLSVWHTNAALLGYHFLFFMAG